ncbi:hypothetical protein CMI47_10595 [Candidatus Pacearchaeota archaeon]|nr:hypothetical protein [Candidatus Pacearchaeota archaeon]|tara:strand:- start:816 stop:2615 length:1800 start_codon:yes stop_codon:yes gene_type:complete
MGRQRGSQFSTTVGATTVVGGSGSGAATQMTIKDEGVDVSTTCDTIDFRGTDVEAQQGASANIVTVYIPTPTYASHWNQTDGSTTGTVSESGISRSTARISTPTSEGNPFGTGGWAASNQSATLNTTSSYTSAGDVTGFGGSANLVVTVYDANGSSALATYTTPAITANATHTSGSGFISVVITNYAADTNKFKCKPTVNVQFGNILNAAGRQGGRFNVAVVNNTDDGTGPWTYTSTAVFLDTNPSTPSISGTVTFAETGGSVTTKHLSGVEYYATGSQFTVNVTDVDNLNRNTARTSANLNISASDYGVPSLAQSPFGSGSGNFANWTNAFDNTGTDYSKTDYAINSSNYRFRGSASRASAYPRDTWANGSTTNSSTTAILVDTYGTTSSDLVEAFDDENRRQTSNWNGGNTAGNWTSTNALSAGEALVMGGELLVPNQSKLTSGANQSDWALYKPNVGGANPNYSGIGAPVSYYRTIVDTAGSGRASFSMVFNGTFVSNATNDLANQHLKIYISRRASTNGGNSGPTNTDLLLLHGSLYNFATFNDGVTDGHIREGSSSGNTVNGTFGGLTCQNGFFIRVEIANTAIKISRFEVTFF